MTRIRKMENIRGPSKWEYLRVSLICIVPKMAYLWLAERGAAQVRRRCVIIHPRLSRQNLALMNRDLNIKAVSDFSDAVAQCHDQVFYVEKRRICSAKTGALLVKIMTGLQQPCDAGDVASQLLCSYIISLTALCNVSLVPRSHSSPGSRLTYAEHIHKRSGFAAAQSH